MNYLYHQEIINKISSEIISSGKEANVFYTTSSDGQEVAVKIYKTMILAFKDREEYIQGEFRFRGKNKFTKTNPHKLIKVWAEKEFRNLKRLKAKQINVPEAIYLKENILMM